MTAPTITVIEAEDDGHDCLDHLIVSIDGPRCEECGEAIDIADATCTWCGHFPCTCDDDYERWRDERMGL